MDSKSAIYDHYYNDPQRTTSDARGAVVFHETFIHYLLQASHQGAANQLGITVPEPIYVLPNIPDTFGSKFDPNRAAKWREKFERDNPYLWGQAASDALQKWIDNDCNR